MTVQVSTLSNGLRVVTDHIEAVQTAAVGVWLNVGTRDETSAVNGVAHMLEHMAFKGTPTRTARQIAEEIEAVGGHLNAHTSREVTAYYARVLKEHVGQAVELLADILQNSTFEEKEFEKERSVVLQEIGQAKDTPDDIIFDYFQERAYPEQPMGWPILGTPETVGALDPETVRAYMKQKYVTSKMVLAAAGNVDHAAIVKMAEALFTDFATHDTSSESVSVPAVYTGGDDRHNRELEQTHLVLGFEGVPIQHPDYYAASVLSALLGGGMSSRLFQEVREKRGLVYTIYAFKASNVDTGLFGIYAGTGPGQVKELLPVLVKELCKATRTISQEEVDKACAQLKAGLMMSLESTSARCEYLAQQMLFYGRPIPPEEIIERIDAVTVESLTRLADRIFSTSLTFVSLGDSDEVTSYETVQKALQEGLAEIVGVESKGGIDHGF